MLLRVYSNRFLRYHGKGGSASICIIHICCVPVFPVRHSNFLESHFIFPKSHLAFQRVLVFKFFIIQGIKARAIPCPHQPPTRGDNTVSVAQGGTATPGATKQLLPPERVTIYIYIYWQHFFIITYFCLHIFCWSFRIAVLILWYSAGIGW